MMNQRLQHKTYFDYLDALRCIAFLAVFYAHTGTILTGAHLTGPFLANIWTRFTIYGAYGVNFFFVLSGFLITLLLLREKAQTGHISIRQFYIKRVLRIWPVYFMTFLFAAVILPFIIPESTYSVFKFTNPNMSWETLTYFFFFVGNFYQGLDIGMASLSIGILWSVCVEEQFYLVWPWVVKLFNTRRLIFITSLLITVSLLYKFIFADHRTANYYLPWSVGMDLAFGALLGTLYFLRKQKAIIVYALGTIVFSLLLIAGVTGSTIIGMGRGNIDVSIVTNQYHMESIKDSLIRIIRLIKTPIVDSIFTLILLYFINRTASLSKKGNHPIIKLFRQSRQKLKHALIYLGKISYGLYAYHSICLMLTVHTLYSVGFLHKEVGILGFFTNTILAFIFTIIVAHYSSVFIEKRVLAYKNRLK